MSMKTAPTSVAVCSHVAGPPEKEAAQTRHGWRHVQRCLRCDLLVGEGDPSWWPLGSKVWELADGRMTTEPAPGAQAASAARCTRED